MDHETVGSGGRYGDGDENDAGYEINLCPLNDKGIHAEGIFFNLDWPCIGGPVAAEIMAVRARLIQAEAGKATVQGNKRHLDGENNDDTGLEKSSPSVNYRAIDSGEIFLDLYPQNGGGTQRPLKSPCHEASFIDDDTALFCT